MYEHIDSTNPMVVPLDRFLRLRENFMSHYFLAGCDPNFGQEVAISWDSFSLAVKDFIRTTGTRPSKTAMRMVHCYDIAQNQLYVRMQILGMVKVQGQSRTFTLIDEPSVWYDVVNGTLTPTTNTDQYDQAYFDNFYYCEALKTCTEETLTPLASDTAVAIYTRTVTLPWMETRQLFNDNKRPVNASLCIAAACRIVAKDVNCKYQHTLVCYLRKEDGEPMINNDEIGGTFYYKAADFGTLCPKDCGVYILPKDRTPKEEEEADNETD